jgi:hypothetical protein
MSLERELRTNWDNVYYPEPDVVEPQMPAGQQPGDVLMAEVGASKLPPSSYSGVMPQGTTMTDTGGGAAVGFRPAAPKRSTGGALEVPINPIARVVSQAANWFGDLVDKGASLYDTMNLIVPGGIDPNATVTLPTGFSPRPGQINPATGEMMPATMGTNPQEVNVKALLESMPVSETIGVRGLSRLAESLGTGEMPKFFDVLDSLGLIPAGTGTAGVLMATAGTAGKVAKELAPTAGEMVSKGMAKLGTPLQTNIIPEGPSLSVPIEITRQEKSAITTAAKRNPSLNQAATKAVEDLHTNYAESDGWAPVEVNKITFKKSKTGEKIPEMETNAIPYHFHTPPEGVP